MTPSARVQAAIEILDATIAGARDNGPPADRIVASYFKTRRYAGSKDRRAVRELVYDAIRACGPRPPNGRAAMLRLGQERPELLALFDGSDHGPAPLGEGEQPAKGGAAHDWLVKALAASGVPREEQTALLDRAPLDVRVNTLLTERGELDLPEPGKPLTAPNALRFPTGTQVEQWDAYREGLVEVQDHGSQLACLAVGATPGETVLDLCAGAGGKTLALAAAMEMRGMLVASDTDRGRLSKLEPRAERAGAKGISTVLLDPGREAERLAGLEGACDAVLVDAPCSGTGTWRRKPEARWRVTQADLEQYAKTQDRLLDIAATYAKPEGRVVFVTCSLLDIEGTHRVAAFLERHPAWRAEMPDLPLGAPHGLGWRLSPHRDATDGFFIARLTRA